MIRVRASTGRQNQVSVWNNSKRLSLPEPFRTGLKIQSPLVTICTIYCKSKVFCEYVLKANVEVED